MPERKFQVKTDSLMSDGLNEDKNSLRRVFTNSSKLEYGEGDFGVFFETPVSGEHSV